ncbi:MULTISPECIES: hypothetical protein [unclassified Streptomyces]|uniref:hypothetical protein n=1 Tax=unclassified Streptomyces TaxID=2593676 RepID=UPI0036E872F2
MTHAASFRHQFWGEGLYELAVQVGSTDDAAVQAMLSALWAAAGAQECYGYGDREPEEQDPVPCTVASLKEFGWLFGRVRLPSGRLVACTVMAVRDDTEGGEGDGDGGGGRGGRDGDGGGDRDGVGGDGGGGRDDSGSDWVAFGVSPGTLERAGVVFQEVPFIRSAEADDWLAGIGIAAFREAPFSLGVIGWNVSGLTDAAEVGGTLPEKRGMGYLLPRDGVLHHGAVND